MPSKHRRGSRNSAPLIAVWLLYLVTRARAVQNPEHINRRILRDFAAGLILTAVLAFAGSALENRSFGEDVKWLTFRLFERQLTPQSLIPVTIVDISDLRQNQTTGVTPRGPLKDLLTSLAKLDPKVIGIDIDFSPEKSKDTGGWQFLTSGDPAFFDFCRDGVHSPSGRVIPIFLGVYRTEKLPPNERLVLPEYRSLAALLLIPNSNDSVWAPLDEEHEAKRTMSAALARVYRAGRMPSVKWPLAITDDDDRLFVDYSIMPKLKAEAIIYRTPGDLLKAGDKVKDKMILIGDLSNARDQFPNPLGSEPIAGTLVHASAACTLNKPLLRFDEPLEPFIDVILGCFFLALTAMIRLWYGDRVNESRLTSWLSAISAVIVLSIGLGVNVHRIVWEQFLLVILALVLHPYIDAIWMKAIEALPLGPKKHEA